MLCCFVANVHRRKVQSITFLSREREREKERVETPQWNPPESSRRQVQYENGF